MIMNPIIHEDDNSEEESDHAWWRPSKAWTPVAAGSSLGRD
jgi:hypothetical protein